MVAAARIRTIAPASVIFAEGDPASSFFVVLSGSVKLAQLTEDGDAVVFRLLAPGDAFGTASVLDTGQYPVSAVAVTAVSVCEWAAAAMRGYLEQDARLSLNVLRSVSERLQALRLQYRQLATENVERRVARAILKLVHQSGTRVEDGVLLDLPLSREDLAQLTGTTVFTASRIVSRWEASGVLRVERRRLVIRHPDTLHAIADDVPWRDHHAPDKKLL
jgi:CRP-like cAMP-binding protein